jgi:hypothetical protein
MFSQETNSSKFYVVIIIVVIIIMDRLCGLVVRVSGC